MLRRRSIRTKIIVALSVLSTIVLLLAGSSFWGLYGNQATANKIFALSTELQNASFLASSAGGLIQSNQDLITELRDEGMIDTSDAFFEKQSFKFHLERLNDVLTQYEQMLKRDENADSDALPSRPAITKMRRLCDNITWLHEFRPQVSGERLKIDQELQILEATASENVNAVQSELSSLRGKVKASYRKFATVAWGCALLALALVGVLLWSLNSLVVKPFRTLLDGSRLVAGGEFDHRIDLGTGDELSELAVAMNEMTDRFQNALNKLNAVCNDLDQQVRDRTREVIRNEQLASVGFLAAGVAHEINNPLASIAWSAESLESRIGEIAHLPSGQRLIDDELSEALAKNLRRIEEEAFRCKGITEQLLDFSRLSEVRRTPTDLGALVQDVVTLVGNVGKYRCKTVEVVCPSDVVAHVNSQEIRQVVLNLVTNALESVGTDGQVDVHVSSDDSFAVVRISDNGCGMSDEVLTHLFEPFFTRRKDGTGTGLGLSITYRIVSQHGGSLIASSDGEGCGATMEIRLPLQPISGDPTKPASGGHVRIHGQPLIA